MKNDLSFTESQVAQLSQLLLDDDSENAISYPELCGFLFGVASAPESIAASEWLPIVLDVEQVMDDPRSELMQQLLVSIHQQLISEIFELPTICVPAAVVMDNLQADGAFSQWCGGFLSAHDWLEDLWLEYTPDEMQDELASMVVILSFFASEALAKDYYAELEESSDSFEEAAEQVLELHAEAMVAYAQLGHAILQAMEQIKTEQLEPSNSSKIERNEPCPCGSGEKYKKCCGNSVSH